MIGRRPRPPTWLARSDGRGARMHILVHALAASGHSGATRHLLGFVDALAGSAADASYTIYLNDEFARSGILPDPGRPHIKLQPVSIRSRPQRVYWDQIVLPRLARSQRADAIWAILGLGPVRSPVPILNFQRTPTYY